MSPQINVRGKRMENTLKFVLVSMTLALVQDGVSTSLWAVELLAVSENSLSLWSSHLSLSRTIALLWLSPPSPWQCHMMAQNVGIFMLDLCVCVCVYMLYVSTHLFCQIQMLKVGLVCYGIKMKCNNSVFRVARLLWVSVIRLDQIVFSVCVWGVGGV